MPADTLTPDEVMIEAFSRELATQRLADDLVRFLGAIERFPKPFRVGCVEMRACEQCSGADDYVSRQCADCERWFHAGCLVQCESCGRRRVCGECVQRVKVGERRDGSDDLWAVCDQPDCYDRAEAESRAGDLEC